ncbi:MAG TPA: hypothetical protein VIL74_09070 [Pyrinomonadaceae bacterium]|jgi:hypothetical protein
MVQSLPLFAQKFAPSSSLTGNENLSIFRGENCFIRGVDGFLKIRNYSGHKNLGENYDIAGETLTGNISWTAGSDAVTGAGGTLFLTELHAGQFIIAGAEVFCVRRIESNTLFYAERAPASTAAGQTARVLLRLQELDKTRAVARHISAVKVDKGDILFVGSGAFYRNGVATGFTATNTPKRLRYNTDGTYTEKPFGFTATPPAPVITPTVGGTKRMLAGKFSFMVSYWNPETNGFSNPSDVIKIDSGAAEIAVAANGRFEFDFTASKVGMPANAGGFIIWQSPSGGGVTATNASYYVNGPWQEAARVRLTDLDADDKYFHECVDGELGMFASGDNDAPPECEFLAEFSNTVFALSSLGKRTGGNALGTNPGNYALCAKTSNKEAFPYGWQVSVGSEINGFAAGIGRLFCLTEKGIPFITATGRTEIARFIPTLTDMPFTSRPFWTKGNVNPYALAIVQGDVFLVSGGKVLMSPRNSSEDANPFNVGKAIQDLIEGIPGGHFFLRNDPKNQQLCVIASAVEKNDAGYWISKIFPLDLETNQWQPVVRLSSDTRDMIVSGAEVVNDRLEFLAGGRVSGGAFTVSTFRYDEADGATPVPYYFAIQGTDNNEEQRAKRIKSIRLTGRVTNPVIQIHGAMRGGEISVSDIENGTNSLSGNILLDSSTGIVRNYKKNLVVKNLHLWSLRMSGEWDGTGDVDEIHEIVVEIESHGGMK